MDREQLKKLGFDPGKLDFPSDRITFGQMRKHDAGHFYEAVSLDGNWHKPPTLTPALRDIDAILLHKFELNFAERAFGAAAGIPEDPYGLERDAVTDDYQTYGLARGEHEAEELLRDLERQAAAQARSAGHSRGI